ncbi:MAG: hypothetical protein AAF871_17275 [Pseudomonadota bacterium]
MRLKTPLMTLAAASLLLTGSAVPSVADVPTYRDKGAVPASASDRLKRAAAYAETPGKALSAPSGPVTARQVIIGNSRIMVISNVGRNSVRDITETARRQTGCSVSKNGTFRTIRKRSISPTGYAFFCTG